MSEALLRVSDLCKAFHGPHGSVVAVDRVSFELAAGETLGLVGESGSGKTTLARCLLRLVDWDSGEVEVAGQELGALDRASLRRFRRNAQMVFQNPFGALNPRMKVADIVAEPLVLHSDLDRAGRKARVADALRRVQLSETYVNRFPRELSGGEQQRVGIARAIITEPRLVVLDEPTAALDAKLRQGVYDLLGVLQRDMGLTYVLISHDLSTVWSVSHKVAVMYLGAFVELGRRDDVFSSPAHPYSVALLSAIPRLRTSEAPGSGPVVLAGELTAPRDGHGCRFAPRCPLRQPRCDEARPDLESVDSAHSSACFRARDVARELGDGRFAEAIGTYTAAVGRGQGARLPSSAVPDGRH